MVTILGSERCGFIIECIKIENLSRNEKVNLFLSCHEGKQSEYTCRCTHSPRHQMTVSSTSSCGRFSPCEERQYPVNMRQGGSQTPYEGKNFWPQPGFEFRSSQPMSNPKKYCDSTNICFKILKKNIALYFFFYFFAPGMNNVLTQP